jgi:putative transcriptional regulator
MTKRSELGREIEAGLREAIAWKRGQIALPVQIVEAMPANRVKEIRRSVSKNTKDFEYRFGVPARTVEGWEQGRKVDVAAAVLLTVIASAPHAVEKAIHDGLVVAETRSKRKRQHRDMSADQTERKRKPARTVAEQGGQKG